MLDKDKNTIKLELPLILDQISAEHKDLDKRNEALAEWIIGKLEAQEQATLEEVKMGLEERFGNFEQRADYDQDPPGTWVERPIHAEESAWQAFWQKWGVK